MFTRFDPGDPRDRLAWRYDSESPLSAAQLIALGSADAQTVALLWLLLEHGASLTVAARPMEVGKTTTLNALLQFLPAATALRYMAGMLEDFAFTRQPGDSAPGRTCAVCNEVNDYPPYYMWGEVARRFLELPAQGYRIATTVHADTLAQVIDLYHDELGLDAEVIRLLGIVVNIGLVPAWGVTCGRRWLTTHFIFPTSSGAVPLLLSRWQEGSDSFEAAPAPLLQQLAAWAGVSPQTFSAALSRRAACLQSLACGEGAGEAEVTAAIDALRACEEGLRAS